MVAQVGSYCSSAAHAFGRTASSKHVVLTAAALYALSNMPKAEAFNTEPYKKCLELCISRMTTATKIILGTGFCIVVCSPLLLHP